MQGPTTANNIEISGEWIQSFNRGGSPGYQVLPIYASAVTMPLQPSFRAGASSSYSGTGTVIVFDTVHQNVGSYYNSSNGRFVCPVDGVYYFGVQGLSAYSTTSNEQNISLRVNGTGVNDARALGYTSSSLHIKSVLSLSAYDYVDVIVANSNTLTFNSAYHMQFMGFLIG